MDLTVVVLLLLAFVNRAISYKVIWNVPGFMCRPYGISFNDVAEKFGFTKNSDEFMKGEVISLLYEPGMFPALLNATKEASNVLELVPKNGGIPQNGNLELHLKAFERMVEKYIPADNKGLVVLDMEEWYPLYELNTGIHEAYQTMSKYVVIKNHPELESEPKKVEEMSDVRFVQKCLSNKCNSRCYTCTQSHRVALMSWLYKLSSALYPSLNLHSGTLSDEDRAEVIRARTNEAMRVATSEEKNLPVYPYISIVYQDNGQVISKVDLGNLLKIPKELGAKGVILWASRSMFQTEEQCEWFSQYLEETLGTLVKETVAQSEA